MDPEDLEVFDRFASSQVEAEDARGGANLADLILEKIAAQEAATGQQGGSFHVQEDAIPEDAMELNPKVVQVYSTYVRLQDLPQMSD